MGKLVFELWDVETRNMIGAYSSETAALDDVGDAIERYGRGSAAVQQLMLGSSRSVVAQGDELAALAIQRLPKRRSA